MTKVSADVSPYVKNEVKKAAEKQGISEAEFVRNAVRDKVKQVQK